MCARCGGAVRVADGIHILEEGLRAGDYPAGLHEALRQIESRHFWFMARGAIIETALRDVLGTLVGRRMLDAGCGSGRVLARLEAAGAIGCGIDMHVDALQDARRRVRGPLCATASVARWFPPQFDAVLLCDVIEHVDDPAAMLREAAAVLRPAGVMLVTVPAGPSLWSPIDEVSGHKRRYTRASLTADFQAAGLRVVATGAFGQTLLVPQALRAWLFRRRGRYADGAQMLLDSLPVPPRPVNAFLRSLMLLEWGAPGLRALPGTSLLGIAARA